MSFAADIHRTHHTSVNAQRTPSVRSSSARSSARHREKQKAYVRQLEKTVIRLEKERATATTQGTIVQALLRISDLEKENHELRRHVQALQRGSNELRACLGHVIRTSQHVMNNVATACYLHGGGDHVQPIAVGMGMPPATPQLPTPPATTSMDVPYMTLPQSTTALNSSASPQTLSPAHRFVPNLTKTPVPATFEHLHDGVTSLNSPVPVQVGRMYPVETDDLILPSPRYVYGAPQPTFPYR